MNQPNARRIAVQTEGMRLYDRTPKAGYSSRQSTYLRTNKTSDEVCVDVESFQPAGYNWAGATVTYRPWPGAFSTELFRVRVLVEPEDNTGLARPAWADKPPFYGAFLIGNDEAEIPLDAAMRVLFDAFQRCRNCQKTFDTQDTDAYPANEEPKGNLRLRPGFCSPQCAHEAGWECHSCGAVLDYRVSSTGDEVCDDCGSNDRA